MNFKKILIYGVGLIGGSLALRIKAKYPNVQISGVARTKKSVETALEKHVADIMYLDDEFVCQDFDLIIFSTPPLRILSVLEKIYPDLNENVLITDVSSVKGDVYKKIENIVNKNNKKYNKNVRYIGSHPMAGLEKRGVEFADAKILETAKVFITPFEDTKKSDVTLLCKFWDDIACESIVIPFETHDMFVSLTSHLPHVLASALSTLVYEKSKKSRKIKLAISTSFKDLTRVAGSDSDLWSEISIINRKNLIDGISELQNILSEFNEYLRKTDADSILEFFKHGKKAKEKLVD